MSASRGLITLIKNQIPSSLIKQPINCGEDVEVLATKIHLNNQNLILYNIYKSPQFTGALDLSEVFSLSMHEDILIAGDFNAHHPILNSKGPTNEDGSHISHLLEELPEITLLNNGEATHLRGGRLDLAFIPTYLKNSSKWEIHSHLVSDHYAIKISINLAKIPTPPTPSPKWNIKAANWELFQEKINLWRESYTLSNNINQLEADFTQAIHHAANASIPTIKSTSRTYKDHWYFCDRVKELKNRLNRAKK